MKLDGAVVRVHGLQFRIQATSYSIESAFNAQRGRLPTLRQLELLLALPGPPASRPRARGSA
jgi:hypothetical protein